jgi:hypothetical protein
MPNCYVFKIYLRFSIQVEHIFSENEIETSGGIEDALEFFGDALQYELKLEIPFISVSKIPYEIDENHKYIYEFSSTSHISFDEDEVSMADEELLSGVLDEYEEEYKCLLAHKGYHLKEMEIFEGDIIDTIEGEPQYPFEMAERLIKKYGYPGPYWISISEFKRIVGEENLGEAYIENVGSKLREEGYILIDLVNEKGVIAISKIESIMDWGERID